MESWLQDMAQEGLFLKKEGIGWGLIRFERGEPRNMQYRLFSGWQEPTLRTIWKNRNVPPSREEQDFHASYGWHYVAQRGLFYIYAREEEDGREMHTDPAVQAIDIGAVSKWIQWSERFFAVVTVLVLGVLFFLMAGIGDFFFFLAEAFGFLVYSALLLAVGFVCTVRKLLHLRRLRQKLQAGECLDHHKPWRKGAVGYRVRSVLFVVVLALYFLLSMVYRSDILGNDPIQNGVYPGDPPFPSVAELIDEGEFTPDPWERTMYSEGGTVFYPVKLHIWEEGELILPDGKTQMVYLRVLYYEARTPAIAETIVRDMLRMDQSYEHLSFEELPPMELDVEYSILYRVGDWGTDLIVRNGNKVLQSCLYQEGGSDITLETWATRMAESVQSENEEPEEGRAWLNSREPEPSIDFRPAHATT